MEGGSPTISNCRFIDNFGTNGGAISAELSSAPTIVNCEFSGNSSSSGGALCMNRSTALLSSCTFAENSSTGTGGALAVTTGSLAELIGCTLVYNSAGELGGGLLVRESEARLTQTIIAYCIAGESIRVGSYAMVTLVCCDMYGNAGGDWLGVLANQLGQNGNICADPRFCGDEHPEQPYTLWADSPCAPESNPDCGLVGAWPVGCDAAAATDRLAADFTLHASGLENGRATLSYRLPESYAPIRVRLSIFDVLGRHLTTLVDAPQAAGDHTVSWSGCTEKGRPAEAGVYLANLRADERQQSCRVVLVRR